MTPLLCVVLAMSLALSPLVDAASDPKISEAAKKEGEMALWTTSDLRQVTRVVEGFERKYPFIKTKIFRSGSVALFNKMVSESLAGKHSWDAANFAHEIVQPLVERKLLARYTSREAGMFDEDMKDKDGYWTAIYAQPTVLGYNTRQVKKSDVPRTYDELLRSHWKGKISIDNQGYDLLNGLNLMWGKERAVDYLRKLAAQGPVFRRGHSLRVQLVAAGEYPLLFAYANPIQMAANQGAPIDWVPLEPVPVGGNVIALATHARHSNAAKLYIDFVLSRDGQEILRAQQRTTVRRDVEPDPPRLIKGYRRVVLQPQRLEQFNETVKLYNEIFGVQ